MDGLRSEYHHHYQPNILCGQYDLKDINIFKFSTEPVAQVELWAQHHENVTFTLTYKYINLYLDTDKWIVQYPHLVTSDMRLTNGCSWLIDVPKCHEYSCDVISPGFPGIYPPNMECHYHIFTTDATFTLQLSFSKIHPKAFNLGSSDNCTENYLEIYDGPSTENLLIGRYCGRKVPDVTASGSHMFLTFTTGADTPPYGHTGFHAKAISTQEWESDGYKIPGSHCDWIYNSTEGSTSSPDFYLPPLTTCTYTFPIHPGYYIELAVTLYGLAPKCKDKIKVLSARTMVDKICARDNGLLLPRFQYNLTTNPVRLKYYTSDGQMQSRPDRGFWLSYRHFKVPVISTTMATTEEAIVTKSDQENKTTESNLIQPTAKTIPNTGSDTYKTVTSLLLYLAFVTEVMLHALLLT